mmetsp:Transcript_16115/g.40562  ORF Transcript_16115/g.40562 Transcript_16115/m.40562 type:complete len:289 (-) Transcript_16115:493-1359(-)
MRVDVVDVVHLQPRALDRGNQAVRHPFALRVRRGDVVRVAVGRVPRELAVNARAACLGVLLRLEQQHAGALAHDEARPIGVEGAAGGLRRVVGGGAHGAHARETGEAERRHRRLRPSGEHHVGLPQLDVLRRLANRVRARGACADDGEVGPLGAEFNGDHGRGRVGDDRRQEEWGDALRALCEEYPAALLHRLEPTHARTNEAAEPLGVESLRVEPSVRHARLGRRHRQVGVPVIPLGGLRVPVLGDVKVLHLARDFDLRKLGVEECDGPDAALPLEQVVEERLGVVS